MTKARGILLLLLSILLLGPCLAPKKPIRLFMAGDSTMQTYREDETPMRGWGQYFAEQFGKEVEVVNKAIGGRSTKTFISEGRWQGILDQLQPGDWVFIQFGHNDGSSKPERYTSPEDYRRNLERFVAEARAKKANPLLLTSICMRRFDEAGKPLNGLGEYPQITREVSRNMQVPLIDLNQLSCEFIAGLGEEGSRLAYMWLAPGEHPKYPEGLQDNTHLREAGARKVAELAAQSIRQQKIKPLAKHLKD